MASLKAFIMVAVGPESPVTARVVGHGSGNKGGIVHTVIIKRLPSLAVILLLFVPFICQQSEGWVALSNLYKGIDSRTLSDFPKTTIMWRIWDQVSSLLITNPAHILGY